jgi:hypothetical protein
LGGIAEGRSCARCQIVQFPEEHLDGEARQLLPGAHMLAKTERQRKFATAVEVERLLERVRVAVGCRKEDHQRPGVQDRAAGQPDLPVAAPFPGDQARVELQNARRDRSSAINIT